MHFTQKQDESIYKTCERFKDILLQCPHHGYTIINLLAFFYNGLTPVMKEYVELMCNGKFFEKTRYEAWAYIETIAEHATRWEPRSEGYDRMSAPIRGGMLTLKHEDSVQARFDSMNKRLQQLELKPTKAIEEKCALCESPNHHVNICLGFHSEKAMMQRPEEDVNWVSNARPYGNNNNYEANWQKNPNLGFGNRINNIINSNQKQGFGSNQQQFGFGNHQPQQQYQPKPPVAPFVPTPIQ